MPSIGQIYLLISAILCFGVAQVDSLWRGPVNETRSRKVELLSLYAGLALGLVVVMWHLVERGNWMPLDDNFEALTWLGLLLAGFVLYLRGKHSLGVLDWFLLPWAILLLIAAAIFGRSHYHDYTDTTSAWMTVHLFTVYGGVVAFALAGAGGAMYLFASRRLRAKIMQPGTPMGSLERLERSSIMAVRLGFVLLTMGLISGTVMILNREGHTRLGEHWLANPKVVMALCVWVVYAIVLQGPIWPSFRGRRTAVLTLVGLLLMIGTVIFVQLMPLH